MSRPLGILAAIVFFLVAFFIIVPKPPKSSLPNQSPSQTENAPTQREKIEALPIEVLAQNLNIPWSLAFLPNGDLLFTERSGRLKRLEKGKNSPLLIATIDDVHEVGESGLLGMALHPNFSENGYIYLYYSYSEQGSKTLNRVVRYRYGDQGLTEKKILVDAIPGAPRHDGGRIKFGPDGFLYITTGDAATDSLAQDKNSLAGKILRITADGEPAAGNPFADLTYSYGHRNPQGLAWDDKGQLWETEHGSTATDEVNRIEVGKNYGWPVIRGDEQRDGFVSPVIQSGNETWAPSGAAYNLGFLYFVGLRGQSLYRLDLSVNPPKLSRHFQNQFGRLRDIIVGPDGLLYISTSNRDTFGTPEEEDDKIIRINPTKL